MALHGGPVGDRAAFGTLQIDVDEKRAHDLVWRKRGTVLSRIRQVLRDIDTDVSAIVEAPESPAQPERGKVAAFRVRR